MQTKKRRTQNAETRAKIAAKMRNNRNAARPEGVAANVRMFATVKASTLEALKSTAAKRGIKIGALLDSLAATL